MRNYEYLIYKLYKEYYLKEPILEKENLINLTIEIQSMFYFLREHGLVLGCEKGFCLGCYKDLDLPMDMGIQDVIIEKMIGKDISLLDDSVEFSELTKKFINIVGSKVREEIGNSENSIEILRMITYIVYSREFVYPSASDEEVLEYMNCDKKDLEITKSLIRVNQEMI